MRVKSAIFAAFLAFGLNQAARTETLKLSCKFKDHVKAGEVQAYGFFQKIDQIIINTDKSSFALRVADTIGTDHELVYLYHMIDDKYCLKPQLEVHSNGDVSGSRLCGGVDGFFYSKELHQFILSNLSVGVGELLVWNCR